MAVTVPAVRRDPLRNYQFLVSIATKAGSAVVVGGVQRVSGLTATVSPFEVWEGGNNQHRYANPDRITWDPVTLEQGLALDDSLERWAGSVRSFAMSGVGDLGEPVKRRVIIDVYPPSNAIPDSYLKSPPVRRYTLFNAWISKLNALPKLDALASEVALISVELVHEGWTVDRNASP
jgi:phage tail-like protein